MCADESGVILRVSKLRGWASMSNGRSVLFELWPAERAEEFRERAPCHVYYVHRLLVVAQHFERDVNHFDLSQDRAALRLCGRSAMTLAASSASRAARL